MSRLGQKNEQGLFTTHCNTEVYGTKNRIEIISEILRNNLVILEIEKLPSKIWGFLRSFLLACGRKVGYVMVSAQSRIK